MKKILTTLTVLSCLVIIVMFAPTVSAKDTTASVSAETEIRNQLKLYTKDNLKEFRQKQVEELKQKAKEIQNQKKACQVKITDLNKERLTERKELLKTYCTRPLKKITSGGGDASGQICWALSQHYFR
jgi:peptidoglycan hydrolase CwlO-like protein